MATPPPPPPNPKTPPSGSLWYAPWINEADYQATKEMAFGWTSTVTAVKGDITLMKVEMAGLFALSLGLAKIDYTWLKLDDKGLTINGRQRLGWPWADKAKHFQLRVENHQRALFDEQKGLKKKLERLTTRQGELDQAQRRLRGAEAQERDAQRRLDEGRGTQRQLDRARALSAMARDEVDRLQKRVDRAKGSAEKLAKSVSKTFTKLDNLLGKEKDAKEQWKTNAATATSDLNALRTALGQTTLALTDRAG
ncbi:hypothetical protein [Streptomyces sp. NPDC047981]|uniref:hypothetical protein n=1 Tax=Streptomyces sp. NPDC047981 TaxID=3154610 RepID=UPI0034317604